MAKLTDKQARFCDEYLKDLNATQAAIRAGYSAKNAESLGYQLLQKTPVQQRIQQNMKKREVRTQITQDKVLHELAIIAFSDATDYMRVVERDTMVEVDGVAVTLMDQNGNAVKHRAVEPTLTEDLTEDQRKALSVIRKGKDGFVVQPCDKVRALELLGKHLGMFTDKVDVQGEINNPMAGLTTEELKKLIGDG